MGPSGFSTTITATYQETNPPLRVASDQRSTLHPPPPRPARLVERCHHGRPGWRRPNGYYREQLGVEHSHQALLNTRPVASLRVNRWQRSADLIERYDRPSSPSLRVGCGKESLKLCRMCSRFPLRKAFSVAGMTEIPAAHQAAAHEARAARWRPWCS
jgi:hypothetical protein